MKNKSWLVLLFSFILALSGCGKAASPNSSQTASAGEQTSKKQGVVHIGYQLYGTSVILKAKGTLDKRFADLGYSVEWTQFPGGPQLLEALNAGSIDLGETGEAPPIFAQSAGAPLVYLAHEPASPQGEAVLVPENSPIKTVNDLKGKKIALNKGSNVHFLLVSLLQKAGIAYSDIEPHFLAQADARAAFEQGSVDAWVIWDPYLAAAQTATHARNLADGTGVVNNYQFYLAARPFAEKHVDLIKAYLAELQTTDDEVKADQRKNAEFLSPSIGIDVNSLVNALSRRAYGIEPMDDSVVKAQQDMADTFQKLGLIPKAIQVKDDVMKADWR